MPLYMAGHDNRSRSAWSCYVSQIFLIEFLSRRPARRTSQRDENKRKRRPARAATSRDCGGTRRRTSLRADNFNFFCYRRAKRETPTGNIPTDQIVVRFPVRQISSANISRERYRGLFALPASPICRAAFGPALPVLLYPSSFHSVPSRTKRMLKLVAPSRRADSAACLRFT